MEPTRVGSDTTNIVVENVFITCYFYHYNICIVLLLFQINKRIVCAFSLNNTILNT